MAELSAFIDDHPLYAEFKSLRAAVARFQDEAHASAIKFQRHTLDSSRLHDRVVQLERENDILKAEIAILRANPHPDASQAPADSAQKLSELTLSLRKLSQKLDVTEQFLLERNTELTNLQAELGRVRLASENAYALGARVRGREEAGKARERDLEWQLREKEEQRRILELAVGEYASLVRSLEMKLKGGSASAHQNDETVVNGLSTTLLEGKIGLQRLVGEFQKETEALQVRLEEALAEIEVMKAQDDASKRGNNLVEEELARVKTELEKLKIEDNTAAKMVSRYMQFSQRSTNSLQTALATLKTRHEATLNTLTSQSFALSSQLRSSESTVSRLRNALDELGLEIMKETYGRRREVTQRIKLLNREERMMEALRRWGRRAEETVARLNVSAETEDASAAHEALLVMAQDARILLEGLDEGVMDDSSAASASGSKARWILGQSTVDELLEELRVETERRIGLEKLLGVREVDVVNGGAHVVVPQNGHAKTDAQPPASRDLAQSVEHIVSPADEASSSPSISQDVPETTAPPVDETKSPPAIPDAKPVNGSIKPMEAELVLQEDLHKEHDSGPSLDTRMKPLPVIVEPAAIPAAIQLETPDASDQGLVQEVAVSRDDREACANISPVDVERDSDSSLSTDNKASSISEEPMLEESTTAIQPEPKLEDSPTILSPTSVGATETDVQIAVAVEPVNVYPSPPAEETQPITLVCPPVPSKELGDTTIIASDIPSPSNDLILDGQQNQDTRTPSSEVQSDDAASEASSSPSSQAEIIMDNDTSCNISTPTQPSVTTLPEISNDVGISATSQTETATILVESVTESVSEEPPASLPVFQPSLVPSAEGIITPSDTPELPSIPLPEVLSVEPKPKPQPEPHPLLSALSQVSKRYDILQRSFRDCHLALESLKSSLRDQPISQSSAMHAVQPEIFRAALNRLDDYTEDARVELEIRVSDEALLIRGYETILSVPGAFSSSTVRREELAILDQDDDEPTQNEVEAQIVAFVDGTDPAVKRAQDTFTRKLEDVQHDIAALKRAIHDPDAFALPPSANTPDMASPALTPSSSTFNLAETQRSEDTTSKGGWTSWIRGGSSRPSSPAPQASTFGSIMTAPRLRPSPSTASLHSNNQQAQSLGYGQPPGLQRPQGQRRGSFLGFGMGSSQPDTRYDPLAPLALKVPMPDFGRMVSDSVGHSTASMQPGSAGLPTPHSAHGFNLGFGFPGVVSPTTPLAPGSAAPMRARTVSTMYMLGLGASGAGNSGSGAMKGRTVSAGPGFGGLSPGLMSRQNSQASISSLSVTSSPIVSGSNHNYGALSGAGLEKVDAGETDVENTDAESDEEDDIE
ncbi:hypothetical protein CVT24_009869 [Panaeolus cyanescens]|uniref:Uncharacterized protein n=1 Tax=Panaeolus cyanescens TaxID=181874 RepID=A0A409VXT1_9AGAR|nr:hypothetical protein CVT24_009869 [Panaeolus cyanescens]